MRLFARRVDGVQTLPFLPVTPKLFEPIPSRHPLSTFHGVARTMGANTQGITPYPVPSSLGHTWTSDSHTTCAATTRITVLQNTRGLYGTAIDGSDGHIGTLEDLYFDDKRWVIRYLKTDVGTPLERRLDLLSPLSLEEIDDEIKFLQVHLTLEKVLNSPSINAKAPISRQYEIDYYRYYGLPPYWPSEPALGAQMPQIATPLHYWHGVAEDPPVRSARAIAGFHIHALDGAIGQVSGLYLDDRDWSIPALVVDAGHWYAERDILISADNVDRIRYETSTIFVNLNKADIQKTHEQDLARVATGATDRDLHRSVR